MRGPRPPELEALVERRRRLGHDLFDEMWEGDYHMAPAPGLDHGILDHQVAVALDPYARAAGLIGSGPFNLGTSEDYRVPDHGLHRRRPTTTWVPSAPLVVEIVAPDDESWDELDFYAAAGVTELIMVDPATRSIVWLARSDATWEPTVRSEVLGIDIVAVTGDIVFP